MKRFLWGVDGVILAGGNDAEELFTGGVLALEGSLIVVECVDEGNVVSGDSVGGVACGIVVSKISVLKTLENVRFASSAVHY